jgi:hypothetical protein
LEWVDPSGDFLELLRVFTCLVDVHAAKTLARGSSDDQINVTRFGVKLAFIRYFFGVVGLEK